MRPGDPPPIPRRGPGIRPPALLALRLALLGSLLGACGEAPGPPDATAARGSSAYATPAGPAPVQGMPDVAAARGLTYVNRSGSPEKRVILEANGAGVALVDLGGDGDLDVVFAQGVGSLEALLQGAGADLELYANDGRARFERLPGPGLSGWWTGLATGDLDGDGRADLVAGAYGDLAVLLQDGRGRLVPLAPRKSGLAAWFAARPGASMRQHVERAASEEEGRAADDGATAALPAPAWFTSLALFDADRDGVLDLYAGRYLDLAPEAPPRGALGTAPLTIPCSWKGHAVFCGPRGMQAQPDVLFAGTGDGGFADATQAWLPAHEPGFTLAVAPFDADMDGDSDLYVACDSVANRLFVNDLRGPSGAFLERGLTAGVALDPDGRAEAGMGIAVGDVDRDGLPDLAVTNFSEEPTQLYLGSERGYRCATFTSGLAHRTRRLLSWSAHLCDLDGDGWLELATANGHVYPQADEIGTGTSYAQRDSLFRLGLDGPALIARPWELPPGSLFDVLAGSRGSALGDLDGDGASELVVNRIDGPCGLGLNGLAPGNNRLLVRCLGPIRDGRAGEASDEAARLPRTPADGMGTRLVLVPEPLAGEPEFALLAEVQTARGYQSASGEWVAFGLGPRTGYRKLTLLWPSGRVDSLGPGEAGRRLTVREGAGLIDVEPLR